MDFLWSYLDRESLLWIPRDSCLSQECRNKYLHTPLDFLSFDLHVEGLLWIPRDSCLSQECRNKYLHTLWIS